MFTLSENATDKSELYVSPSERNECEMMSFDVYRKDSIMAVDGWRELRNACIVQNLRFGNETQVDPETMLIVTEGGTGIYDFLQDATPDSLGMTSLTEKIRPFLAVKVETFIVVNNLIPTEALA